MDRRYRQVRLSTLFLLVALTAVVAAWWRDHREAAQFKGIAERERDARLVWEMKYKNLSLVIDELGIDLERIGRPLEDLNSIESADLKKSVDDRLRDKNAAFLVQPQTSTDERNREEFQKRMQFIRDLSKRSVE